MVADGDGEIHLGFPSKSKTSTPPKTNMEPENTPLEKDKDLQTTTFLGSMLVFGGVLYIKT